MKYTSYIIIAAIAAIALPATGRAQLLNGDFSGNATSYVDFPGYDGAYQPDNPSSPSHWTAVGVDGLEGPGTNTSTGAGGGAFGPVTTNILDGSENVVGTASIWAFLQPQSYAGGNGPSNASLSQTFDVTQGATYNLTYDVGPANRDYTGDYSGSAGVLAEITDGTDTTGNLLYQQESTLPTQAGGGLWENTDGDLGGGYGFTTDVGTGTSFTADATGAVTLTFYGIAPDASFFSVDLANVSIEAAPEPSVYMLMLGGLSFLVLLARRKLAV